MKHKNKNAVIVDIGAQSGLYSLYAKYLPECKFYSFEPFQETYKLLLENLQLNSITNVEALNVGLGEKNETKVLHVPDHLGLNTLGDTPTRFSNWKDVEVSVKRLDDVISEDTPVDYIKCDTEGWELFVLKGAERCIKKWKPEIFLEFNGENLNQCGVHWTTLLQHLLDLHYVPLAKIGDENIHFTYREP
jgi:FkbM family methyltransferase